MRKTRREIGYGEARNILARLLRMLAALALRASILLDFVLGGYGSAYGVRAGQRLRLLLQFQRNVRAIPAGTTALTHTMMAREILSIPPDVAGAVVECGIYKGASSASLSLVCHLVGRRLLVCDSFEGLPNEGVKLFLVPHIRKYGYLKGGMFRGTLAEVQQNLQRFGRVEVCEFVPGLFAESLQALERPLVFAFLDVDLPSSFRDCLRAIWPLLVDNGAIYVDDVGAMDVVQVFFDQSWWQDVLGQPYPGLVGSGCGLPLQMHYSNIGYVRKLPPFRPEEWEQNPDLAATGHDKEVQP